MASKLRGLFNRTSRAEDPVCHMQVSMDNPPGGTFDYESQTYYFCGPGCRVAFSKEPKVYLSGLKRLKM